MRKFEKLMQELRENADESQWEVNEALYDKITEHIRKLNEKYDKFKKYHKALQPKICEGPCGETKHKKYFNSTGYNYNTCDDCMKVRKKKRKEQKIKDKVEESLRTYNKKECYKLYDKATTLLHYHYVGEIEFKDLVKNLCDNFNLAETEVDDYMSEDSSYALLCFQDISGHNIINETTYKDEVYNKTGTILTLIIQKLEKCRKRTKEERRKYEEGDL